MTLMDLNNYAIEKGIDIEINDRVPEELILERGYDEKRRKK